MDFDAIEKLSKDGIALTYNWSDVSSRKYSPWLEKYIFPGGYTPAMSEMVANVERNYLYITDIEVWRLHYAKTLHH